MVQKGETMGVAAASGEEVGRQPKEKKRKKKLELPKTRA